MPVFMHISKQPCGPDVPGCLCLWSFLSSHVTRMCPDACVYAHLEAAVLPGCARMLVFMFISKQPSCPDVPGCLCLCTSVSSHAARMCPDACVYGHLQAAMRPGCARMPVFMRISEQPFSPDVPGCLCLCTSLSSHAAGCARMPVFMHISKQPCGPDVPGCLCLCTFLCSYVARICPGACVYVLL